MNDADKTFLAIQESEAFTPENALKAFREGNGVKVPEEDAATRNWIIKNAVQELVEQGPTSITFTKKDGTERVLVATKQVPQDKQPKGPGEDATEEQIEKYQATQRKMAENHNLLRVFDMEKQDWRSVIVDTIKCYNLLGEYQ